MSETIHRPHLVLVWIVRWLCPDDECKWITISDFENADYLAILDKFEKWLIHPDDLDGGESIFSYDDYDAKLDTRRRVAAEVLSVQRRWIASHNEKLFREGQHDVITINGDENYEESVIKALTASTDGSVEPTII